MHAKHIPFEVIQRIIQFTADAPEIEYKSWKSQLQFLSISKAWRESAMPVVYKTIFVDIHNSANLNGEGSCIEGFPKNVSFVSNLKLIKDNVPRNIVRLNELIVEALIQPRDLVQLVQNLPEIVELDVLEVNTEGDMPQDFSNTNIGEDGWTTLAPLNTSIKRLRFGYHMSRYSIEKAGTFLVYLLLRMPQLTSVTTPSRLHVYVNKAKQLARFYPHMEKVKIY
ncbi:hypothetical protein IWW36_001146 [Coemansia brasiliensis]|uniref:F-box domain-containing protein n=1 Tax=Coemansia brasiliensis TaxID=2650707 RepID=A0A9W8IIB0_9FUNG|nr:hypothetical protein IWW36_001146 [Coemansia brasiliensis]